MTETKIELHIGNLEDMGQRFMEAWRVAETGQAIQPNHVTFLSLESFVSAMSPKRLELMRHLHASGPMSVRALSKALNRNYKSVHVDASILTDAGLIERPSRDVIRAPWDKVVSELNFTK